MGLKQALLFLVREDLKVMAMKGYSIPLRASELEYQMQFSFIPKTILGGGVPVVANKLDCDIIVSEFKLQLCCYVHFQTKTTEKATKPLIS